jgi:hypothetical protein
MFGMGIPAIYNTEQIHLMLICSNVIAELNYLKLLSSQMPRFDALPIAPQFVYVKFIFLREEKYAAVKQLFP